MDAEASQGTRSRGMEPNRVNPAYGFKLAAMIETTEARIIKEKENYTFVPTKSFQDAHEKLMKNRVVVIEGNAGEGKTSIAFELLHLLCRDVEEGQQQQQQRRRRRRRHPLELHNIKDLDLVLPTSHLVIYLDDIFGKNVVHKQDVEEWKQRENSIFSKLFGNEHTEGNFLIIASRSGILSSLNGPFSETVLTKKNIVELGIDAREKLEMLKSYEPKDNFVSWTDNEEKEIVMCAPDTGFPQCCSLFRDAPSLHTERVNFFRRPFCFMKSFLSKLEDGKCYSLMYLFLNGGEVKEEDLDHHNENFDKNLLEEAFAVDIVKVTPTVELLYNKERKVEFVKESLNCLLGWLVKKEPIQKQGFCYKFNHDSIEETVALLYGEKTPLGYIQNCPRKFLSFLTTSPPIPNRIRLSSNNQYNTMFKRLVKEFESDYSVSQSYWFDIKYQQITSLDVWTDTQFLQGFIRWLSDQNVDKKLCHQIKLALLNEACSSGAEECVLYLLSEGVKPDKKTPFYVVKRGSLNVLRKLLEYDVTPNARAGRSQSSHIAYNINVLQEACLFEREEMVTMLCDTYPHLVHDTVGQSTLHLVALTGNCFIFQTVERTVLTSLCRKQKKCESVDGRVVKEYLEATGRKYDITTILDKRGRSVLDKAKERVKYRNEPCFLRRRLEMSTLTTSTTRVPEYT
ncbi:hypothetical protein KP79_PYT06576 [Mizuhopecten yessoensis]|uniref:Novel STAND NTPase 3 domain-containing protein n=1 Tax=Mizuhopecten yessoensis TaxID=6573 RepID=A0A210Q1E4_MIZYE|nr:hypothetical protein KP79_PYT06576 [Mizuhopecten yessoensis]